MQVVLRYPGSKWQVYGDVVHKAEGSAQLAAARRAHPNAHLATIEGSTREFVAAYRERLTLEGDLQAQEGPGAQGVPPHEAGEGGDHDKPYSGVVLPDSWPVQSAWLVLAARVQRGELGGPDDGQPQEKEGVA
jgi:hypothetical protein